MAEKDQLIITVAAQTLPPIQVMAVAAQATIMGLEQAEAVLPVPALS
jgi:hypothetical protein